MIIDLFDLDRFVTAQDAYNSYNNALQEIKDGRKKSHWMWYVFPQIQGLGHSSMSQKYSIKSLLEAQAYLEHETLGTRLYEMMIYLPINVDAEKIFGKIDAMKLRSCLTLFDLVAPDGIFAELLDIYFNKKRCQKTMKIVESELFYYKNKDAFGRNGINEVPRAFLEGIDGSNQLTYNNRIGTLLDLFAQGETMRKLVSHHLWSKCDFSDYRVSNIKCQILSYMRSILEDIANNTNDDALVNEMNNIYCRYIMAKDNQLLEVADAFDTIWKKINNDKPLKSFVDSLIKNSLCKHIEESKDTDSPKVPEELLTMMYGQIRTLIDLLKELNKQEPIKDINDASNRLRKIIERNVRYGDEFAFMAMRTIWSIMNRYEYEGAKVDIEQLERDMLSFHDGNEFLKANGIGQIFYNYSVRKMVKYIQFLNEFRRYCDYESIRKDLQSIPASHCGGNDPQYYYSFYQGTINSIESILSEEWANVTKNGMLDNALLEQVAFGRFDNMVKEHGLKETIRLAYGEVGCHPDIQAPRMRKEGIVWGPIYRIIGKHIEKGCSDFRRWPWTNISFEMKFAHEIFEKDKNYMYLDSDWQEGLYLPVSDYTLPVYSQFRGKMHFESQEEKIRFIEEYKSRRNAD